MKIKNNFSKKENIMKIFKKITFIGSGKIAESMIIGLINSKYPSDCIFVCSPDEKSRSAISERYLVKNFKENLIGSNIGEIIVLAVKPNIIPIVCEEIKNLTNIENKLIISVAAGININSIKKYLNNKKALIARAMPNTPVLVREGVIGLYAKKDIRTIHEKTIEQIFNRIGKIFWLSQEKEINYIISASSSATAYFFLMMDAMKNTAENIGINKSYSREVILQTAKGAIVLAEHFSEISFNTLKKHITSKKGTTEAALNSFKKNNFRKIVEISMKAAVSRAKEISIDVDKV
ncbi:proC [Wigglesworthia glossinidia endosymbiont of Glossina brevipalpis]|uniref:Pyrroline-5-carboxylate reductase n=1 Tax=Wigglesworthia glossinidia brevipalpis TaxID=36870 RepID=Q8D3C2_WIGBR|nr:proC [Wigglesworthia glossinidia endosymbiont of Glossina brevipalpis]